MLVDENDPLRSKLKSDSPRFAPSASACLSAQGNLASSYNRFLCSLQAGEKAHSRSLPRQSTYDCKKHQQRSFPSGEGRGRRLSKTGMSCVSLVSIEHREGILVFSNMHTPAHQHPALGLMPIGSTTDLRLFAASPPSPPYLPSMTWNFRASIMSFDQNEFSDLI